MDEDKVLTYEEARQMCRIAFDAGADYGSTCTQFNCNAVAYDWEHWLKKNEGLFRPKPDRRGRAAGVRLRAGRSSRRQLRCRRCREADLAR